MRAGRGRITGRIAGGVAPTEHVLSHDLGTTGDKACLFSRDGVLMGSAFEAYHTYAESDGAAEQDPDDWWNAVTRTTRALLANSNVDARDVACISFTAQMMGCLPVDKQGTPLRRAIIWADLRARAQALFLREAAGGDERVYRISGQRAIPTFSAAKILWLRDNEPAIYSKAAKFLNCKDYIVTRLCGRFATDPSDASGTNLFDLGRGDWSDEILGAIQLDRERLPEVRPSTAVIGPMTGEAAGALGLLAGTPVVQGGADGSCAAAGAGAVSPGDAYINLGTSGWLAAVTEEPILDPAMRLSTEAHVVSGLFSPNGTSQNCCSAYQWWRGCLAALAPGLDYGEMDRLAEASPPGCRGLLFVPYLLGERSPYSNPLARGTFLGLARCHALGDLTRAVLEGVALNIGLIASAMADNGVSLRETSAIGGGATSRLWVQILADVLNRPVSVPRTPRNASSLGAAMCGGIGVGLWESFSVAKELAAPQFVVEPVPESAREYASLRPLFERAYEATLALNADLARKCTTPG